MNDVRVLDLFCGAGGAAMGLHRAWPDAEIVGVDIKPQPRYPFNFIQCDALSMSPRKIERTYDFIWASPPCQAHTAMKTMHNAKPHVSRIKETRALLNCTTKPYVIENVPGAPLIGELTLCGTMFGLGFEDAELRRHRIFEYEFDGAEIQQPQCKHGERVHVVGVYGGHLRNRKRARTIGVYGEGCRDSRRKLDKGVADFTVEHGRKAMGIDWMTIAELCEAVPPAYSEYIARQFSEVKNERR